MSNFINPFQNDVFPPRDLPGKSEQWGRTVESRIEAGEKADTQIEQTMDNGLRAVAGQLEVISRQLDTLDRQQRALEAMQVMTYLEDLRGVQMPPGVWLSDGPSVTMVSPTGRIEVGFGGSGSNAQGFFTYSITSNGSTIRSRTGGTTASVVAVIGGASYRVSGFNFVVEDVPPNVPVTIKLEVQAGMFPLLDFWYLGGRISGRVVP